ncbi:MAG TPA: 16S rRNA (cytosine(1402)-N(4))-methyltransferase, partial [Armatimonadota bacterium]
MSDYHKPVMLSEIVECLKLESGLTVMDCTVGGGGHALEIVKLLLPDGKLIGIDQDDDALSAAAERLSPYRDNVILEKGNFSEIGEIAQRIGIDSVDGVLMDLGVSSYQLDAPE